MIKCQNYHFSYSEVGKYENYNNFYSFANDFEKVDCEVLNKITVKELSDHFKEEKWEAGKYNVLTHKYQIFGAEIIKILKAIRIDKQDKVRMIEKTKLPGCIINSLGHNEELSWTNTLERILVFGLFHDMFTLVKNK